VNSERRQILKLGLAGLVATLPACATRGSASAGPSGPPLGFSAIPVSTADNLAVPPGYRAQVLYAWGDPAALKFRWDMFALAGEDKGFGSPDGLWFDSRGVLWIQTDVSTSALNRGPYEKTGNNQMLAADVTIGEIRRFLTGPAGCEITGATMSPDGYSLFLNVQHPGEPASERSDPGAPRTVSNWPDFRAESRPRAATVVVQRNALLGT
jgi:secreted PhoX family phosphatase